MELDKFTKQVDDEILKITISEKFKDWAIRYLHEVRQNEAISHEETLLSKHKKLENVVAQIDSLLLRYTSPDNSEGQMMTNEEYIKHRSALLKEKTSLEKELNQVGKKIEEWLDFSERTFNFACYASMWFEKGDLDVKRAIFACLGSNLFLKFRILDITLQKPFKNIFVGLPKAGEELERLELFKMPQNSREFEKSVADFPIMSG